MKSAPKQPQPVDPSKVIPLAESANINTGIAQQALNQTNQVNPYGSSTYAQTGTTMVDGHAVPTYTQTTSLAAPLQQLLSGQWDAANSALGNLNLGNLNFSGLQSVGDPNLLNQQTIDALYGQAKSRLDPQWAQTSNQLENRLAEQGIPIGSKAYDMAMQNYNMAKNDAYTSAQNSATEAGVRDASQLYSDKLAGRQQGIQEQLTQQNQPLSVLAQILGGLNGTGSSAPSSNPTQVNVQTPDVLGAYGLQQQGQQANYNNQMQQYNSMLGGISSLGGSALAAAMMYSDERLKTDIHLLGRRADGLGLYSFCYAGLEPRFVGVLAQEVEKIDPEAVRLDESGYRMVDYGRLGLCMAIEVDGQLIPFH